MGTPPFLRLDNRTNVRYNAGNCSQKREQKKRGEFMEWTFGSFIRERRKEKGLSLREQAARLGLSAVYMSNIETDRRAAPTQEYLDRMAAGVALDKEEYEQFLDLAAKSKRQRVSSDLPEYIMERDIVRAALRTAKEVDATDEEWQEFIDRITRRERK